jgi:hypothetical protein
VAHVERVHRVLDRAVLLGRRRSIEVFDTVVGGWDGPRM